MGVWIPHPLFPFSFMRTLSVIGLKAKTYKEEPVWTYESSIFLRFPQDKIEFSERRARTVLLEEEVELIKFAIHIEAS